MNKSLEEAIKIKTKATSSRIGRGILSLPKAFLSYYPKHKCDIKIRDIYNNELNCSFSPYSSNHAEARIGKLLPFFRKNDIYEGQEMVLHIISPFEWRLIPQSKYNEEIKNSQKRMQTLQDEKRIDAEIHLSSVLAGYKNKRDYVIERFSLMSKEEIENRKNKSVCATQRKEALPAHIKQMYRVLSPLCICQASAIEGFIMQNGQRYIEFHHLRQNGGHHPKNILMLCANVHRMFHYARAKYVYSNDGWLENVDFPDMNKSYTIERII